jgi:hypothetical protein
MKKFCLLFLLSFLFSCNSESNKNIELLNLCIENSPKISSFENETLYEGGFSGLAYIPNSDNEFFTVTDRGPNTQLNDSSNTINKVLFPIPHYTQKIIRLKLENNKFKIISIHPIKDMNGHFVGGLPPINLNESPQEVAFNNKNEKITIKTKLNFDFEGISLQKNGNFWLADEYRPALVEVDGKTFKIKQIISPVDSQLEGNQLLDFNFSKRRPNRGFEGITVLPSGKIVAMLQSPIEKNNTIDSLSSRLVRIVQFDPKSKQSKVFGYEMSKGVSDPKIGDIAAINEDELLIIEHGNLGKNKVASVFKLNIKHATDITNINFGTGKSFEALVNNSKAQYYGISLAEKTLVFDLIKEGYQSNYGKPEGISIIDNHTIAIVNDNDFGIDKIDIQKKIIMNKQRNCIFIFKRNLTFF